MRRFQVAEVFVLCQSVRLCLGVVGGFLRFTEVAFLESCALRFSSIVVPLSPRVEESTVVSSRVLIGVYVCRLCFVFGY